MQPATVPKPAGLLIVLTVLIAVVSGLCPAHAQMSMDPPLVFGYFQNTLAYVNAEIADLDYTSFSVQQLNIMMQKDLTPTWSAFVNLEFLNSFSTQQMIGDLNLVEAWVRYRINQRMSLKVGLHIPEFNRLNTIKTKMPVLPYIIRPLAYESSLSEVIPTHEYVPEQAYVSLYGALPVGQMKLDHVFYVGNSPNLSTTMGNGQSAVDTSTTFLYGLRIGLRSNAVQAGVSATLDYIDYPQEMRDYISNKEANITEIPRIRLGSDLRIMAGPVTLEGEMIRVHYDDDISETLIDKEMYYGTAMISLGERLTVFGGYWYTTQEVMESYEGVSVGLENSIATQRIPNIGAAYIINDQITAKVHVGKVDEDSDSPTFVNDQYDFMYYSTAVSVMF